MERTFALQWHITDKCDQRCKHCYIYSGEDNVCQQELELEILEKILHDFLTSCKKLDVTPFISVTGGDPLLHKNAWDVFEMLHRNNVRFGILGNPFHLTSEAANKLYKLGCDSYQMSLDGLRETHDFIRKKGSFDTTLEKIKTINESGMRSVIMTTVSRTNINEILDIVPIVVEAKVNTFAFSRYCPNENDISNMVTAHEYKEFLEKMWEVYNKYQDGHTRLMLKDHLWKLFLYERGLLDINDYEENMIYDGCHCGITHLTVLADGTVYACRRCESPVGKVPEESLYDIFVGGKMDAYRNYENFEACSKCELLRFCRGCPAVAKCATGNFYAKDPQCWKQF